MVVLIALAGGWGARYVQQWREAGRPQVFYQQYFEPALMIACGHGFVIAQGPKPAIDDFVSQKVDRVRLRAAARRPAGHVAQPLSVRLFYLMWMVGLFWAVFGVSWSGLVPLFGGLFAVVIGLAYAAFRLAVPPWLAWPAAAALVFSTLHLQNLPHLRDYAKAPFVIGLLLILFCIVKRPEPKRVAWLCALYGVVLGIGYGFRSDFLANIPPLFITVLLFVPGFNWRAIAAKVGALAIATVLFVGTSWPAVSYVVNQGACSFHVILVGLEHNFNFNLGVTPSYYGWISRMSDEYIHSSINSFIYRTEGAAPVPYCTPEYDAASGAYLKTIAANFPADMLTRAYASTLRVADLPFYLWGTGPDTTLDRSRLGRMMMNVVGTGRLAVAISVLLIGAYSWRLGLFALFTVLYFGGYPSLQFGNRHFFHLEFLGWWALAFVVWQSIRLALSLAGRGSEPWEGSGRAFGLRLARFGAVVALLLLVPLPIVRSYQDAQFAELRGTLLNAPRVLVPLAPTADGTALELPAGVSMDVGPDRMQTAYLDIRIDLAECPRGVPLVIRYDATDPFHDYTRDVQPQPVRLGSRTRAGRCVQRLQGAGSRRRRARLHCQRRAAAVRARDSVIAGVDAAARLAVHSAASASGDAGATIVGLWLLTTTRAWRGSR